LVPRSVVVSLGAEELMLNAVVNMEIVIRRITIGVFSE